MSSFSRLFDLASKALGDSSEKKGSQGGTDWRGLARSAADALGGEGRARSDSPAPTASRTPAAATPPASPGLTPPPAPASGAAAGAALGADDRAAIARYDYLMKTADPQQIEDLHRDAFARLTPEQRAHIQSRMDHDLPAHERPRSSSASDLARAAARTEAREPGRMRGLLSRVGGRGAAIGVGGAAVGVLGAVAGGAVLSAVAGPLLEQAAGLGVDFGALAEGIDLGALTGGAEDLVGQAGEQVSGLGDQLGGWGEQLGDLGIPGLGDLFGR